MFYFFLSIKWSLNKSEAVLGGVAVRGAELAALLLVPGEVGRGGGIAAAAGGGAAAEGTQMLRGFQSLTK